MAQFMGHDSTKTIRAVEETKARNAASNRNVGSEPRPFVRTRSGPLGRVGWDGLLVIGACIGLAVLFANYGF